MSALVRAIATAVSRRPGVTTAAVVALTVVFGVLSSFTVQEDDFDSFATDGEVAQTQDQIAELFGSDDTDEGPSLSFAQLIVRAGDGDVVDADSLQTAIAATEAIRADETIAGALADADAIGRPAVFTWADVVLGAAAEQGLDPTTLDDDTIDQLLTGALAEAPSGQAQQVASLLGGEVSDDRTTASHGLVVVLLDDSDGRDVIDEAAQAFLGLDSTADGGIEAADGDTEVFAFEALALQEESNELFAAEINRLFGIAVLLIIGLLVLIYRNVTDVVVSLLGLVFTITWAQGFAALLGPRLLDVAGPYSQIATIIPILLIGLGVDYAIHLTMRAREEAAKGADETESTAIAVRGVGVALVLATVTTVVGFLTNLANPLPPLQDFGVFAAFGVLSAFLVMTTFPPAVRLMVRRALARRRARRADGQDVEPEKWDGTTSEPSLLGQVAAGFTPIAVKRSWAVVGVVAVLSAAGGYGFTQLSTEFSQTEFFPTDSRAFATFTELLDAYGSGLDETTDVLAEGDVTTAEGFNAGLAFQQGLADVDGVRTFDGQAQVDSLWSRLAQTGTELGPVEADADAAGLVDQLLAADPSATAVVTPDGDAALFSVSTAVADQVDPLRAQLQSLAGDELGGFEVGIASEQLFFDEILDSLRSSQTSGLVITLVASALILALVFQVRQRQGVLGLISIAAVAVVALWAFGLMAAFGIPFNVLTAMTSALAIGIGVPFGIHVVNRFWEDCHREPDIETAMRSTLENTGGALLGSAITTMAGFGSLILASIGPFQDFGLVIAMTIGLALVSSLTFLPAMLSIWQRRRLANNGGEIPDDPTASVVPDSRDPVGASA